MDFLSDIWNSVTGAFRTALEFFHDFLEPVFGFDPAWGWAIIVVTLIVRVALLPLALKQTRSMRAMQDLQPKIKKIQERYPADRELAKKDPELYRKRKAEQNERMMALYQEEGVNPAASCLPLLAQAPIFFALFSVLRSPDFTALQDAQFYFITGFVSPDADAQGLGALISQAGWPGIALILLMIATTFITQRQMMARNAVTGPQAQQQKIMLYVLPVFLGVISFSLPLGVILYWVTTNGWQGVQQWIIFRDKQAEEARKSEPDSSKASGKNSGDASKKADEAKGTSKKQARTSKEPTSATDGDDGPSRNGSSGATKRSDSKGDLPAKSKGSTEHLPRKRR